MVVRSRRSSREPRRGITALPLALALALVLVGSLSPDLASAGIVEFYPVAVARTEKALDPKKLKATGDLEIDGFHLALWGSDPRRPTLFSMTPFRVTNPAEQLAIFGGIRTKEGPSPAQDWGYVFDRNGDGHVDYLCYFMGPMPIEGADFPADFPKREADGKLRLKKEDIEFLVRHLKPVFYHVADDDFDGRADGVVIFSMDPDRNWVDGWGLFRSTKGDGDLDDARRFRFDITKPTGTPERVEGGWAWMGLRGERKTVSSTVLEGWSAILGRINVAAAAFELKPGSLPKQ